MGHQIKPKVCDGCNVPKGWGEEIIIEKNEMYCGKLLKFKKGNKRNLGDIILGPVAVVV